MFNGFKERCHQDRRRSRADEILHCKARTGCGSDGANAPVADILAMWKHRAMPRRLHRFAGTTALLLAVIITGSCSSPTKRLDVSASRICTAQGGYESRSAFGYPICQFRYADGGKTCIGKADCEGRCLLSVDGSPHVPIPRPGEAAKGLCQAERYSPGCFATIEAGRVTAEGAVCED